MDWPGLGVSTNPEIIAAVPCGTVPEKGYAGQSQIETYVWKNPTLFARRAKNLSLRNGGKVFPYKKVKCDRHTVRKHITENRHSRLEKAPRLKK